MEPDNREAKSKPRFLKQIMVRDGGRALIRNIPDPIKLELRKATKRSVVLALEIVTGVLILGLVGLYFLNNRLDRAPISFQFAVEPIQAAINRELTGLSVKIENAIIAKGQSGTSVRFLLQNIQLFNNDGITVAKAPYAAVGLSGRALLSGKLAAGSVDLIGSRLSILYRHNQGISFSFPETADNQPNQENLFNLHSGQQTGAAQASTKQPANRAGQTDSFRLLAGALSESMKVIRTNSAGSSYLTRFGLEDTILELDYEGKQSSWNLPLVDLNLSHGRINSVAEGRVRIRSGDDVWEVRGRLEGGEPENPMVLSASMTNFVPSYLTKNFSEFEFLKAVKLPLSGNIRLAVDQRGNISSAEAKLMADAGNLPIPGRAGSSLLVKGGELRLKYDLPTDSFIILPTALKWDGGRATLKGAISPAIDQQERKVWVFSLETEDAVLEPRSSEKSPTIVESWKLEGIFAPALGQIQIDRYQVGIGKAYLNLTGYSIKRKNRTEFKFDGQVSPMPVSQFIRIWPESLAVGPWSWVKKNVRHGRFEGGTFSIQNNPESAVVRKTGNFHRSGHMTGKLTVDINAAFSDLTIKLSDNSPALKLPNVQIQTNGNRVIVDIPNGHFILPSGRLVNLTDGSFKVDDLSQENPTGIFLLKMKNTAAAVVELANQEPVNLFKKTNLDLDALEGDTTGSLSVSLPLQPNLSLKDLSIKSDFSLDRIRFGKVLGGIQVQGGRIDFKVTEKSVLANGDIVFNGVPASLKFQRLFDEDDDKQPPVKISGVFDDSARDQLGIKINRFIEGPIPVTLTFQPGAPVERRLKLEGDLTGTAIFLDQVPWKKNRGRNAKISFYVVKGGGEYTELREFKLVGEKINFDGWMTLDQQKKMIQYEFKDFSFDGQNQVQITGRKRRDQVWNVNVRGALFNGQPIFRNLFLAKGNNKLVRGRWKKKKVNLDLRADIDKVIGYSDADIRSVSVSMKKRDGKLSSLNLQGTLDNNAPLAVRLVRQKGQGRIVLAETNNAGSAFRVIGMYPSAQGGQASMRVFLDGKGDAERTGTLWARNFYVLGDPIVQEVLSGAGGSAIGDAYPQYQYGKKKKQVIREKLLFQQLEIPFSVGHGQFVLHDSILNGPLLGATMRGRVDFEKRYIDLGGTYVPLYGLNSAVGALPIIGEILMGRRGEGLLGITFGVKGKMTQPEVLVNPMSMVAPGIFRQMFEFSQPSPKLIPRK